MLYTMDKYSLIPLFIIFEKYQSMSNRQLLYKERING